jgi:HAD superfamily hydrolase (TIGR01484 family)
MRFDDVRAVFTDLDGTMTTGGQLLPSTYAAMAELTRAGVPVVIVTGRPAGWGEAIARLWPVTAVVTENGCVSITRDARGRWKRRYVVPAKKLAELRRRMHAAADEIAKLVPGARLSSDSTFTEVNLAVDWNEDVKLPEAAARRMETLLRERGFAAVRSSVHVNFWPRGFDKLWACRRIVRDVLGGEPDELEPYLYVGDALNDEPMFKGFPRSVGVANIRHVWDDLEHKPAHVTRAAEGAGFEELVRAILRAGVAGEAPRRTKRASKK